MFKGIRKMSFIKKVYNSVMPICEISKVVSRYQAVQYFNSRAFAEFKGAFAGRDIVIVAAGPSVNEFIPIENAVYIGMNRSCMLKNVKFDFLFAIDLLGINSFMDEFKNYVGNNCIKFIGEQFEGKNRDIPESFFLSLKNARKYKTDIFLDTQGKIPVDIDCLPLWNGNSVAHQVLQFALFTNPKRIFLVGCDCSGIKGGHFVAGRNDENMARSFSDDFWKFNREYLIQGWQKLKDFAEIYYPDTEIISVNPVGLRGMFKDLDQK